MPTNLTRSLTLVAALALPFGWPSPASAQDKPANPPKDEALDDLLKKLDDPKPADGDAKKAGDTKPKAEATPADKPAAKDAKAGSAEVAPKDKPLDTLLEKLGESEDTPAPDERKPGAGGDPKKDQAPPPGGDGKTKDDPNALSGKDKSLDEALDEAAGKRKKKDRKDPEGGGPMGDVIKQMREVEQRLGKTDTGEQTRKQQAEIVKRIDTLIEQMRSSQSQSKGKRQQGMAMNGGQPGQENSETAGTNGGNAPHAKPKEKDGAAFNGGKEAWGHLPPELRQEMENVFKEEALPGRDELIRRYYLSVAKKKTTRGN